eukprot:7701081-Karenia_brevis.AAC.1
MESNYSGFGAKVQLQPVGLNIFPDNAALVKEQENGFTPMQEDEGAYKGCYLFVSDSLLNSL